MRSDSEYVTEIEREARRLGFIDDKVELGKQWKPYDFEIDIKEALRSGVFICGGKGQAKTNLAKIVAHKLLNLGYVVKVLDLSRAWLKSSIPCFYEVKSSYVPNVDFYQSIVYDLSTLTPKQIKNFVARFLAKEWNEQIAIPEHERKWIIYVFEETQMLTPQGRLRSNEAQEVLRLMTSGRNYNLSYVAISQRASLCDTSVFELTFQRYFSRMSGENDKNKVAQYIGSLAYDLEKLKLGEFFYDMGSVTKWIHTEEFKPKMKPRKLEVLEPKLNYQKPIKPKNKDVGNTKALANAFIAILWLIAILVAIGAKP